MAKKSSQAGWLSQLFTEWARTPVTVAWESDGVGRGDWWARWSDGPTVATLREQARAYALHLRPLDVTALRWGREYTPQAWATALLTTAETEPGIADWRELLGVAESWLDDANWPDQADEARADRAAQLVAAGDGSESVMARAALAQAVTKSRDETVCPVCGDPVPQAGAGWTARYCSPACRTRAWRHRAASDTVTETRDEKMV